MLNSLEEELYILCCKLTQVNLKFEVNAVITPKSLVRFILQRSANFSRDKLFLCSTAYICSVHSTSLIFSVAIGL